MVIKTGSPMFEVLSDYTVGEGIEASPVLAQLGLWLGFG